MSRKNEQDDGAQNVVETPLRCNLSLMTTRVVIVVICDKKLWQIYVFVICGMNWNASPPTHYISIGCLAGNYQMSIKSCPGHFQTYIRWSPRLGKKGYSSFKEILLQSEFLYQANLQTCFSVCIGKVTDIVISDNVLWVINQGFCDLRGLG